jgi:hypothetical protein
MILRLHLGHILAVSTFLVACCRLHAWWLHSQRHEQQRRRGRREWETYGRMEMSRPGTGSAI